MKNLIAASMLTIAAAGGALAYASPSEIPSGIAYDVRLYVPDADLSNLTRVQIAQLTEAVHSSATGESQGDVAAKVESILRAE